MKILKRTKNSKHYDIGNGKMQAVIYQKPVHYLEGKDWKDIVVEKDTKEFMGWERDRYEKNNFKTRLKDKNGSDLTEMATPDGQGGEYWITIKTAIEKAPVIKVSDIHIRRLYEFKKNETIINPKSTILLDSRLKAEILEEGVIFKDGDKTIFKIKPPVIENDINYPTDVDSIKSNYSREVHFKLIKEDKYYLLEKEITTEGLTWIEKSFIDGAKKITVDDTLTLQPDSTDGKDNYLRSPNPTLNYGGANGINQKLFIGRWSGTKYGRWVIRFDLSSIPASSTITTATQTLYNSDSSYAGFTEINCIPFLVDWGEGVGVADIATTGESSWNYTKKPTTWTTSGASSSGNDISSSVIDTTTGLTENSDISFDVKNTVQTIVDGDITNYGWRITSSESQSSGLYITSFFSSEAIVAANRPKLTIVYTPVSTITGVLTATGINTITF